MSSRMNQRKRTRREQRERKEPLQFMWAFGSNLSLAQMKLRCPEAKPYKPLLIPNGRLVFRGVADVEHSEGGIIPGALYQITPRCERSLDIYEGVGDEVYEKRYLKITVHSMGHKQFKVLYYKMKLKGILPPTEEYIDRIARGYRDWDLDTAYLDEALNRAWEDKAPTAALMRRQAKKGYPRLARVEQVVAEDEIIEVEQ